MISKTTKYQYSDLLAGFLNWYVFLEQERTESANVIVEPFKLGYCLTFLFFNK